MTIFCQAGTDVEVTWKLLEVPSVATPDLCEETFDIDELWNNGKGKETLACLKIDATVKSCSDLSPTARGKIIGC